MRVRDDRGLTIGSRVSKLALERGLDYREQTRYINALNESVTPAGTIGGLAPLLAWMPVMAVGGASLTGRYPGHMAAVGAVVFTGMLVFAVPRWLTSSVFVGVRAAALAVPRCPACAYRLGEIEPEPDGCTVCPECGAAWRLPDDANNPA